MTGSNEISSSLAMLPSGTAEGAREPLRYAHERLGEFRRSYMPRADALDLAQFTRGGFIDQKIANLYVAIGTARHQLAVSANEEITEDLVEPIIATPPDEGTVSRAAFVGEQLTSALASDSKKLEDLIDFSSENADSSLRQLNDAKTITQLANSELKLQDNNKAWRRRLASVLAVTPGIIAKGLRKLRRGIDISEKCWNAFDDFQRNGISATFSLIRGVVSIFIEELDNPSEISQIPGHDIPPIDFDIKVVHQLILKGEVPDARWIPWIFSLNFNGQDIGDISLLKYLTELKSLQLDSTNVKDISPLVELNKLNRITLDKSNIKDFSHLSKLGNLTNLSLSWCDAENLEQISGLSKLQILSISGTKVSDLTPISNLNDLRVIDLIGTNVSSLEPLSGLKELTDIAISGSKIKDLSPLGNLKKINTLYLGSFDSDDFSVLSELPKIETIYVSSSVVRHKVSKILGDRSGVVRII